MYNVKGPSKIVAKTTRRGVPQNIESFRDTTMKSKSLAEFEVDEVAPNGPKPIFQTMSKKSTHQSHHEYITPQQEEIIRYINESWNLVCSEIKYVSGHHSAAAAYSTDKQRIVYYKDDPCPLLQNFKPFDLEAWWGRRLYTYITSSINSKS